MTLQKIWVYQTTRRHIRKEHNRNIATRHNIHLITYYIILLPLC